jgi:DNA-binding PadR family transcriptional regulator
MSVRNALLGLLAQKPRHGYELHAAFEAVSGGEQNWDVKPAQIYTTLARLEESGFVKEEAMEQGGGPERKLFTITAKGRGELTEWFTTGVDLEHQRDEFFIKLMLAIATGETSPRKVLQVQRSKLYQNLHSLTTQRNHLDPKVTLAKILLMDKAIMHVEADLRWLDMVEGRLDDVKKQPLPEPEVKPRGRPKKI